MSTDRAKSRSHVATQAAKACEDMAKLFGALPSRVATADAIENEGALEILEEIEKRFRLVYETCHVLARGAPPSAGSVDQATVPLLVAASAWARVAAQAVTAHAQPAQPAASDAEKRAGPLIVVVDVERTQADLCVRTADGWMKSLLSAGLADHPGRRGQHDIN